MGIVLNQRDIKDNKANNDNRILSTYINKKQKKKKKKEVWGDGQRV